MFGMKTDLTGNLIVMTINQMHDGYFKKKLYIVLKVLKSRPKTYILDFVYSNNVFVYK